MKLDIKGKACGIPGRTIPLPSVLSAGCGLAWRAELSDRECLIAFMKEHDIRWEAVSYTHLDVYKRQYKNSGTAVTGFADISKAKNMALADGTVPVGQYTRAALVNSSP